MKKISWNNVSFIKSAVKPSDYPTICDSKGTKIPQIAAAGRSNVGKSSLLNSIFCHRSMAKVSQTPGKTQTINFFRVDDALMFVDLPGYGFAKCPLSVKKSWDTMMQNFFSAKERVDLLLCLFDSRRLPNDEDRGLLEWARYYNIPHLVVITKIDKLKKSERDKQVRAICDTLLLGDIPVIVHSSQTNEGLKLLQNYVSHSLCAFSDNFEKFWDNLSHNKKAI